MDGNQNLPNRQITSNKMTSKPLLFPHRSRSNSGEHRSSNKYQQKTLQSHIKAIAILNLQAGVAHRTHAQHVFKGTLVITTEHNHPTIIGMEIA